MTLTDVFRHDKVWKRWPNMVSTFARCTVLLLYALKGFGGSLAGAMGAICSREAHRAHLFDDFPEWMDRGGDTLPPFGVRVGAQKA